MNSLPRQLKRTIIALPSRFGSSIFLSLFFHNIQFNGERRGTPFRRFEATEISFEGEHLGLSESWRTDFKLQRLFFTSSLQATVLQLAALTPPLLLLELALVDSASSSTAESWVIWPYSSISETHSLLALYSGNAICTSSWQFSPLMTTCWWWTCNMIRIKSVGENIYKGDPDNTNWVFEWGNGPCRKQSRRCMGLGAYDRMWCKTCPSLWRGGIILAFGLKIRLLHCLLCMTAIRETQN